jgi:hypothetical protein
MVTTSVFKFLAVIFKLLEVWYSGSTGLGVGFGAGVGAGAGFGVGAGVDLLPSRHGSTLILIDDFYYSEFTFRKCI